jgi:hypothetical protein
MSGVTCGRSKSRKAGRRSVSGRHFGRKKDGTARNTLDLPLLRQLIQITTGVGAINFGYLCNFFGAEAPM